MNNETLTLAQQLINCPSITPNDAGCQSIIADYLRTLGFSISDLSEKNVTNLWARYGNAEPLLIFAGHTDVVSPGALHHWHTDPFAAVIKENHLIGRGAQDMKAAIAAMLVATKQFIKDYPNFPGSVGFAITSAEEGDDYALGTPLIVKHLQNTQQKVDWCVIGEPSCSAQLGDCLKNGRRGSLHAYLTIEGIQGHVAYPHLAKNPIHCAIPALHQLQNIIWCEGNTYFPPTTMQMVHLQAGDISVGNIIPAELHVRINWRYSALLSADAIQETLEKILREHQLHYHVRFELSGEPFITPAGHLTETLTNTIKTITGITPELSTSGGTSDGRFLAKLGCQTVEFGTCNNYMHKINEQVSVADLEQLTLIYYHVLKNLYIIEHQ